MNSSFVAKVYRYLLPVTLVLAIMLFLPVTPNYYSASKALVLIASVAVMLVAWGIGAVTKKEVVFPRTALFLPVVLFIAAVCLNFFTNKEGWTEALTSRGLLYIGGALIAFGATIAAGSVKTVKWVIYSLIGVSSVLALHGLLHLTVLYKLNSLPTYMASRAFTPTGSPLVTLTILIIGAVATFYYAARALKGSAQYGAFALGTLQTIAAVAYISLMLPGTELASNLIPYQASWAVTLDALKTPRSILFGVGLANFPELFTAVKPLSLNAGPLWNITPVTATSELLQLLATGGILTLGTFLLLPLTALTRRSSHSDLHRTLIVILCLSFVAFILTPISIPVAAIFFIAVGLSAGGETHEASFPRTSSVTAGILAFVAAATVSYFGVRIFAAENHVYRAQKALAANDGRTVYTESLAAVKLIPAMANYRLSYSQVNLSLASALSQKTDLTDQDREQVTGLVQQAINEAKVAASLRPSDVRNWQNLGMIYRNLINVATSSDQFAVSAYAKAVSLDPGNPSLRVDFGGLLFQLAGNTKDDAAKVNLLSRAIQQFQTAVQLKSDYANAYYNLSKALESAGNIQGAYAAMQKVVASLDPNSPDLGKATTDLETLKTKLPKASPSPSPKASAEPSPTSELVAPSPLPSPIAGGPLELPAESATPAPSPSL